MSDGFMFKLAQIRGSYTRKKFGTINNEEKALIDYETFCLELIKEIEQLQQENNQLKQQRQELRSWLEEHYDFSDCIRIKSVLDKLNELEGGKNE